MAVLRSSLCRPLNWIMRAGFHSHLGFGSLNVAPRNFCPFFSVGREFGGETAGVATEDSAGDSVRDDIKEATGETIGESSSYSISSSSPAPEIRRTRLMSHC